MGGREGVDHPKRAKAARCGCSKDGEGAKNTKHAQTGVFRVFSGRKVSEHVGWDVGGGGGSWTRKMRRDGAFFVFAGALHTAGILYLVSQISHQGKCITCLNFHLGYFLAGKPREMHDMP